LPGALKTQLAAIISPLAGNPAPREMLIDPAHLEREYFERSGLTSASPTRWSSSEPADTAVLRFETASTKLTFSPAVSGAVIADRLRDDRRAALYG
jgi:hypothetical protein